MQNTPDLSKIKPEGVDLSDRVRSIEAARQIAADAADSQAEREALQRVQKWDRSMQRIFKGIMPRPYRHAMLRRAVNDPRNAPNDA